MNTLKAGFSRVNVTPALGTEILGYCHPRYAEGVLDELEINALARAAGDDRVVLMSADLCYINKPEQDRISAILVPSNMPNPEDMPLAHKYNDLHKAGRDGGIPFEGMELTTVVAESARMVRLANGPATFALDITGVAIGNVAILGIPGELFNGIGLGVKKAVGWDLVMPCCTTNGYEGYFPMQDAYDEGGYEARSSRYKVGTAELLIQEGVALLNSLR